MNVRSSVLFTIALAERFSCAVANDSGTGHMFAAADTTLISLFGPTDPEKFAPFVTKGTVIIPPFNEKNMNTILVETVEQGIF